MINNSSVFQISQAQYTCFETMSISYKTEAMLGIKAVFAHEGQQLLLINVLMYAEVCKCLSGALANMNMQN